MKRNLLFMSWTSKSANKCTVPTTNESICRPPKEKNRPPKGRIFYLTVAMLLVVSSLAFAQRQWDGSNTTTGAIYREGPVGIGTTTPNAKLDVVAPTPFQIRIQGTGASNNWLFYHNANAAKDFGLSFTDRNGTFLKLDDRGNSSFPTGPLGIGTTDPKGKLHVVGDIVVGKDVNGQKFILHTRTQANGDFLQITGDDGNGNWEWHKGITFVRMTGNVGIKTTNPTHALSVNGSIRAKEIIVNVGWSDFVFEDDYKLMPLHEVESYIKVYGHLPDVPTATEVRANGVGLGEMQAKLLQKIEELTLYLIEVKKENTALNTQLSELRAQTGRE